MPRRYRHFVSLDQFSLEEITDLIDLAAAQKADEGTYRYNRMLKGRTVGLFFEKPSLRTRLSFEVAVYQLGGQCLYMGPEDGVLGSREAVKDQARVAARYLDAMVLRTKKHETIVEFAKYSDKPVINGLSDEEHPCQALGDLLTIREKLGRLAGVRVAYIGDGNNVCRSLAQVSAKCGMMLTVASPAGYELPAAFLASLERGGVVRQVVSPAEAMEGAEVVYTDVWVSMGQEAEADERRKIFQPYQINQELLDRAPKAIILHCLPAHRGEEITDQAMDSARSAVYDQAENRLHAQRALFCRLLG